VAGVLTLVRLKLTLLRRSMTGSRGDWMVAGAVVGTGLAVSTIVLSALYRASPAILGDLLGVIYALWLAGWIVGPVWGGAPLVRAEHFALIPVPPRRLAVGLLGTAFAGITTAVTLLAFISLVVFGARLGVLPALVAVPVVVLQLVLVVLLSRLAVTVFGQVARSRISSAVVGVLVAGLLILSQSGWMLAVAVRTSGLLSTGVTPAFATLVRALPSGWGLYAVEAAGRSDWLTAVGVLAGLAAAIALLLAWSWKLGSPRAARATIRGARRVRIRRAGPLSGAVGAVAVKELRTWWRDPLRVQTIAVSLPWALGTCLLPLTFGSKVLLPWAGPAMALTAVTSSVNLYGQDGTALWLTLVIPGAERNDVHGRQRAFLFLFGPVVTVAAVALTALAGPAWTWPWVLALTRHCSATGSGCWHGCRSPRSRPAQTRTAVPTTRWTTRAAPGPRMSCSGSRCCPASGRRHGAGRHPAAQRAVALGRAARTARGHAAALGPRPPRCTCTPAKTKCCASWRAPCWCRSAGNAMSWAPGASCGSRGTPRILLPMQLQPPCAA
jgi:hypothetical protein